jgi:hypothetical protein
MKILAIESEAEGTSKKDFEPFLEDEAMAVWNLSQQGFIREIYFDDKRRAVLILECRDLKDAEELLSNLPLVKEKLISFQLTQLKPYTGYSRLFNKEA